jgi:hypothetical protein
VLAAKEAAALRFASLALATKSQKSGDAALFLSITQTNQTLSHSPYARKPPLVSLFQEHTRAHTPVPATLAPFFRKEQTLPSPAERKHTKTPGLADDHAAVWSAPAPFFFLCARLFILLLV